MREEPPEREDFPPEDVRFVGIGMYEDVTVLPVSEDQEEPEPLPEEGRP